MTEAAAMAQAGIAAIGNILGGIGAYKSSRAQSRLLEAQGQQARREAGVNAQLAIEDGDRVAADAAVDAAAGGGGLTGSALGAIDDLRGTAMFNARTAIYAGVVEGRNLDYQAKVARRQGEVALLTKVLQAGGDVSSLGGMGKARQARIEASRSAARQGNRSVLKTSSRG